MSFKVTDEVVDAFKNSFWGPQVDQSMSANDALRLALQSALNVAQQQMTVTPTKPDQPIICGVCERSSHSGSCN